MTNYICIATFVSKPGKERDLHKALANLVQPSKLENGCVSYNLYEDADHSGTFTMFEEFKSKEDFDFHSAQEYLVNFKSIVGALVESVNVSFYHPLLTGFN